MNRYPEQERPEQERPRERPTRTNSYPEELLTRMNRYPELPGAKPLGKFRRAELPGAPTRTLATAVTRSYPELPGVRGRRADARPHGLVGLWFWRD